MAFECRECWLKNHPEEKEAAERGEKIGWDMYLFRSLGPCEDCRITRICIDD